MMKKNNFISRGLQSSKYGSWAFLSLQFCWNFLCLHMWVKITWCHFFASGHRPG